MVITIDFECFSEADLPKVGAWAYSLHPSTDIVCMSWGLHEHVDLWTPHKPFPSVLAREIKAGALIESHGDFDPRIWEHVGIPKYGFPEVPVEQWRCSMATAAFRALPLKLEWLAKALELPVQKDMAGNKAMRRISKPDKKTGKRITEDEDFVAYDNTYSYCRDDNRVERLASDYCGQLPAYELPVWQMDQRMQRRGLQIDQELCRAAIDVAEQYTKKLNAELSEITSGHVETAGQVAKLLGWLHDCQAFVPDLTQESVDAALVNFKPGDPRYRALEIRRYLSRSSHKKYSRALECICPDGRVRGATQYYGATRGRNAGRLFQPLNMRRPVYCSDTEAMADAIKTRDLDFIEMVGGANIMEVLADAVRGIIVAGEGKELCAGDYSAIEAVVTAGMANECSKLEVFHRGDDPYCWFAEQVVGHKVTKESHQQIRQEIGKPGELAFGFAGGVGAWRKFDTSGRFTDDEIANNRDVWRSAHPRVVDMWDALDHAAINAVNNPGTAYTYRPPGRDKHSTVVYIAKGDYLLCQLPSGRRLHYFKPVVTDIEMPWTDKNDNPVYKPGILYWTMSEGRWQRARGWRGIWTENIVSGIARDLMVIGARKLEEAGYPPVLTVYDEVLTEPEKGRACLDEYISIMLDFKDEAPYAADWPINCSAWTGGRYRKD